jgi:hypothetical protein
MVFRTNILGFWLLVPLPLLLLPLLPAAMVVFYGVPRTYSVLRDSSFVFVVGFF